MRTKWRHIRILCSYIKPLGAVKLASMKWIMISAIFVLPQSGLSQFYGELNGGVTWSKMSLPSEIDTKINPTYNPLIGATIVRTIKPNFSATLSARYTSLGFIGEETELSPLTKFRLNYLMIVPTIEYQFTSHIEVGFGLSIGTLLSTFRNSGPRGWENVKEYNFYRQEDIGLVGDLRYRIQKFYVSISYHYGLSNISADNWTDLHGTELNNPKAYNRSLTLSLSYRFKL